MSKIVIMRKASAATYSILAIVIIILIAGGAWLILSDRNGNSKTERPPLCGDGKCQPLDGEKCETCAEDCGCGNGEPQPGSPPVEPAPPSTGNEPPAASDPLLIKTLYGSVKGRQIGNAYVWLGVPFAKPPVENFRFRYAQNPDSWTGVKNTIEYPAPCAQGKNPVGINPANTKEDCLYLNVFKPAKKSDKLLPVVLWVHGGSNLYNSAQPDTRNFEDLYVTQRDVILVTIQYRLGPLGWMPHPALDRESGSSGNYGLSDIIKSFEWVNGNIKSFGGDPSKLIAVGGSAGSIDLCAALASAKADGLVRAVVMQSGTCAAPPSRSVTEQKQGLPIAQNLGCTGSDSAVLACLRGKPWQNIFEAFLNLGEGSAGGVNPVYDASDPFLADHPEKIFIAKKQARATMIIGAQIHDSWRQGDKPVETLADLNTKISNLLSEFVPQSQLTQTVSQVLNLYPANQYQTIDERLLVIRNDFGFNCANRRAALLFSANAATPAYWYVFTHAIKAPKTGEILPVFHGSINPYWNQQIREGKSAYRFDYTATPDDLKVADYMIDYYVSAAASGNPNNANSPIWPKVTPASATPLLIQTPALAPTDYHKQQCDFYDNLVRQARGF